MDAGQPARAPALPFLAVCAGWPFCFHALTDWFSRRRSVTWAIGNICRMQLCSIWARWGDSSCKNWSSALL